jgi:hypothetical protein
MAFRGTGFCCERCRKAGPRLSDCPRHGFDRPDAECLDLPECSEVCRDCMGTQVDPIDHNLPCSTCSATGLVTKPVPREDRHAPGCPAHGTTGWTTACSAVDCAPKERQ